MIRVKKSDPAYKDAVDAMSKLASRHGAPTALAAMRKHLNRLKQAVTRQNKIEQLRSELEELERGE